MSDTPLLVVGTQPPCTLSQPPAGRCIHAVVQAGYKPILGLWAQASNDVWGVGVDGALIHFNGSNWEDHSFSTTQDLLAVTGFASNNVWAVGTGGAILHWTGSNWTPSPSNTQAAVTSIWGSGANDIWVTANTQLLHYTGATWSAQHTGTYELKTVWGSSATDVWAAGVGATFRFNGSGWNIVTGMVGADKLWGSGPNDVWALSSRPRHWDGQGWTEVVPEVPNFSFVFQGVHGSSADNVWAVGRAIGTAPPPVLRWDGTAWRAVAATTNSLYGIWGATPNDAWAVGQGGVVVHWDGAVWTDVTSLAHPYEWFTSVHGTSASDVWAVGDAGTILHFNGTSWENSPSGTTRSLFSVFARTPTDAWAVGNTVLHWDGVAWSPSDTGQTAALDAVWAAGPSDVWAFGINGTALRWNGAQWNVVPSDSTRNLRAAAGRNANDIWVVGDGEVLHWNGTAFERPLDSVGAASGVVINASGEVFVSSQAGNAWYFDGVTDWVSLDTDNRAKLWAIWSPDQDRAVAVGEAGTMLLFSR